LIHTNPQCQIKISIVVVVTGEGVGLVTKTAPTKRIHRGMGRFYVLYVNIKTDDALDYHRGSLQSFPGKNAATFLNPVHN
jgi:hypothetical protein